MKMASTSSGTFRPAVRESARLSACRLHCTESSGRFLLENPMCEWRDAVGYAGLYQVSDDGRVRRHISFRGRAFNLKPGDMLAVGKSNTGYPCVELWCDGSRSHRMIHRLVYEAFHDQSPAGLIVHHVDGSRDNNGLSNLSAISRSAHAKHHNKGADGRLGGSRLSIEDVRVMRARRECGHRLKDIALDYGITVGAVWRIAAHKRWAWLK